jgi:hypothetical protein
MTVRTVSRAATHSETVRCLFAIELSKQSWVIGFEPQQHHLRCLVQQRSALVAAYILLREPSRNRHLTGEPGNLLFCWRRADPCTLVAPF